MKIFDITVPIRPSMPIWPGDPQVAIVKIASMENGAESNVSQLKMSVHTGTHIDVPKHFLKDGKTVDQIPLEVLIGDALVIEIEQSVDLITWQVLVAHVDKSRLKNVSRVLFKTRNSLLWASDENTFQKNYVGLDQSAAEFLCQFDLHLIGIDYLSIAHFKDTKAPHQILLSKEIILLEGVNLSMVARGRYKLVCLPLNIHGSDGAPARAMLLDRDLSS